MKPIDKLMDCQYVKRWTLVATTAESNVASHSFGVAMIALAIRNKMYNNNHIRPENVVMYALLHDVDEAETGDIATPTKIAMREAGVDPNSLFETQGMTPAIPAEIGVIIKLADLIENYVFIREHGSGARARAAVDEVCFRLQHAIAAAPDDVSRAAHWVLDYIINRRSETDAEERRKIEEDRQRKRSAANFSRTSASFVMGGESCDGHRIP